VKRTWAIGTDILDETCRKTMMITCEHSDYKDHEQWKRDGELQDLRALTVGPGA
jgi:hypothetical protein